MTFDIGDGVDSAVNYILDNFSPLLDLIAAAIGTVTNGIQNVLLAAPMTLGLATFVLLSLWRVGFGFAVFTGLSLWLVEHMGLWSAM
ncbi:MAG TPA: proline/glycine betaine ABC transporter permease, partial [Mycoplana sp.]|nr:proline/glycine betaine ABC transporter permease [Mycoplana sp.]